MLQRYLASACVLSLGLLAASSSSHAQNLSKENTVTAKVAFAFHVGDTLYPAGSYEVGRRVPVATSLVIINDEGKATSLPVIAVLAQQESTTSQTSGNLVFNKVGDKRFLSEVWLPGEDGYLVHGSATPHEHEIVKPTQ